MINNFIKYLEEKLANKLPGKCAQDIMAPNLRYTGSESPDPRNAVPSGVLILLFPSGNEWSTVFIKRTGFGPHGGQISLPGGRMEKFDADIIQTALREANEEIGVDPSRVIILGKLTPLFVPNSNFCINPVVGYLIEGPEFIKDPEEVESIIKIGITDLYNGKNKGVKSFIKSGKNIEAPYYDVKGHVLWGATAMVMSEFEAVIS